MADTLFCDHCLADVPLALPAEIAELEEEEDNSLLEEHEPKVAARGEYKIVLS